jgi:hypothetical protein
VDHLRTVPERLELKELRRCNRRPHDSLRRLVEEGISGVGDSQALGQTRIERPEELRAAGAGAHH